MANQRTASTSTSEAPTERVAGSASMVVCSLEPWGEVRRRLRILVDEIVDLDPTLRVLYVAPSTDIPHRLRHGQLRGLTGPRLTKVHPRIHVLRPRKWLPRVVGGVADNSLERQVLDAVGELGLHQPLLWVNDAGYARFAVRTGWPTLYDITDDWQLAPLSPRALARLVANEDLLLDRAGAVVVCSPDLARTRGATREVELIPNGVDVELFRTPRPRPAALPEGPVALYVGTLASERLDVDLIMELAAARPDVQVVLVGPNSLPPAETERLEAVPTIHLLGARPYDQVPGFLQHADVVIIPHQVNPFTESLDPIKAYECVAVGRPTVATPVAGFRQLGPPVVVAGREDFVAAVGSALSTAPAPGGPVPEGAPVPSWHDRAESMLSLMDQVREQAATR
jgi:teichuronic acid biosynthesis glycosyltransferase TuaH